MARTRKGFEKLMDKERELELQSLHYQEFHNKHEAIRARLLYLASKRAREKWESSLAPREEKIHCSFCDASQDERDKLVVGKKVAICNECIQKAYEIINED